MQAMARTSAASCPFNLRARRARLVWRTRSSWRAGGGGVGEIFDGATGGFGQTFCNPRREGSRSAAKWSDASGNEVFALLDKTRTGQLSRRCQDRSEEHTSELQSLRHLVCRLL